MRQPIGSNPGGDEMDFRRPNRSNLFLGRSFFRH